MAPTSCGCGRCRSTSSRTTGSARKSSPASPTSIASCATPSATCSARSKGSARTSGWTTSRQYPELERYMLQLLGRARPEAAQRGRRVRLQQLRPRAQPISATTTSRPSTSISARTASIATRRRDPSAEPTAPSSTPCSTRSCAGSRRCWCSPPRKYGARAIPRGRLGASARVAGRRPPVDAAEAPSMDRPPRTPQQSHRSDRTAAPRKIIGSSLEAEVTVAERRATRRSSPSCSSPRQSTRAMDMSVTKTGNHKCGRCWRHLPEVGDDGALCARCEEW